MTSVNAVSYCWVELGPGRIQRHIPEIRNSGLDTIVLWALHIGGFPGNDGQQWGDLYFNDPPVFVRQGRFNPDNRQELADWPGQVAQLKGGAQPRKVFFSIGGASDWVWDFRAIEYMLKNGMRETLKNSFVELRRAFTINGVCAIDGFDIDNEEPVEDSTIVDFCTMLFELEFEVTFCPYDDPATWQRYMQTLRNKGHYVSWWNVQFYAGGHNNLDHPQPWIDALAAVVKPDPGAAYLVAGLAVKGATDTGRSDDQRCPDDMCATFARLPSGLAGGFLWHYDFLLSNTTPCSGTVPLLHQYLEAIRFGLTGRCDELPTA